MKVLVIGPSPTRSKGGMATVIKDIQSDVKLNSDFDIDIYESYVDGNIFKVILYSAFAIIRFYLTKKNYDVYHIHMASRGSTFRKGFYVRAAKKWGKKVILHIHGAQYMEFYNEISEKKKKKVTEIIKLSDLVLALSDDWKKKFESAFKIENCQTLNNGIDTKQFENAVTNPEEYQSTFVFLGRLGERKGVYDLVNAIKIAVKQNENIKLYMAGDGEIEQVKNAIEDNGLTDNIDVFGWVDFDGKIDLLKKASTLVLPSYNEGLPMSVLEGMACGKAIISTTVGAIPEVVTAENGILINPGDVNALADAIVLCSTDTEMLKRMQSANIKKIDETFSMRIMHEKLKKYYEMLR